MESFPYAFGRDELHEKFDILFLNSRMERRMESRNRGDTGGFYTCGARPQHAIEDEDLLDRQTIRPK